MGALRDAEPLPEPRRNDLLRKVDWRFLLRMEDRPRAVALGHGPWSEAVELISDRDADHGGADVVVLGYPSGSALAAARAAVRNGGEIACFWDIPVPGASHLARRALRRAGFSDIRLYWPGPLRRAAPKFWLPLGSAPAAAELLARRPPAGNAGQAILRPLWRLARRLGVLGPVWALARAPGGDAAAREDGDALAPDGAWLLLTGGERSINKVVGLPLGGDDDRPSPVVKFARVPEGDDALEREARALRSVEERRPGVPGVPRVVAEGWRSGRRALAQSEIEGRPMAATLSPATFGEQAAKVTAWLAQLAGREEPRPPESWWDRLVEEPLADLEHNFGAVLEPDGVDRARDVLRGLGPLPEACEHRDCSPWNVVLSADGAPALLDWESAEPRGLPALDLVYFLSNAVFRMENAFEKARARQSYARLLDPGTAEGGVASRSVGEYCERVGIDEGSIGPLRLLCWIVHTRSDHRHLEMEAAGPPSPEALRGAMFLGLVEEELSRAQALG
jgi:hypothetical protein